MFLTRIAHNHFWKSQALLIARLLMGGLFLMAAYMKFTGIQSTAGYITAAGFPSGVALAVLAAFFELIFGLCLVTGVYFREAALLLGAYVIFLAFAFHGPSTWVGSPYGFGFFIDHFTMLAGLLFMAAHGPGETWKWKR